MFRSLLLAVVAPITLAGCLNESRACDLAVEWLEQKGFPTQGGKERDWELRRCANFRTQRAEDSALIEVAATVTTSIIDDVDKTVTETEISAVASCALVDWDQGWTVEACVPR